MEIIEKTKEFLLSLAMLSFAFLVFVWLMILIGSGAIILSAVVAFLAGDLNWGQFLLCIGVVSVAIAVAVFLKLKYGMKF